MSDIKLKNEVLDASAHIKAGVSISKETGFGTVEDGLFKSFAVKQGLEEDVIEKVDDVRTTFAAGAVHAVGELAIDAMVSNKNLTRASAEIPMGKRDTFSVAIDRRKEFPNFLTGGEPVEKFAVVSAQYDQQAGKNAGQLKKAKTLIAELGLEKLK